MKRVVFAAEAEKSEGYEEAYNSLKDNFDYALEGCEKLSRDGKEGEREAIQLMLELNSSVEAIIQKIATKITQ